MERKNERLQHNMRGERKEKQLADYGPIGRGAHNWSAGTHGRK